MSDIKFVNIDIEFGNQRISNFVASILKGRSLTVVGDQNSGREALIQGILGFAPITAGSILVDEDPVHTLPANQRKIVKIGSDWSLFPHLSIEDNVSFGLRFQKLSKTEIVDQKETILKIFGLLDKSKQFCTQLRDIDRFKVALARAAAIEPNLIIFEDPFQSYDVNTRLDYLKVVSELQRKAGLTFLFSTSSPTDYMGISTKTAVLANGYLEQYDETQKVYESPTSVLSAKSTGEINCVKAQVVMGGDFTMFSSKLGGLNLRVSKKLRVESEVSVMIRPEHTRIVPLGETEDARNVFSAKIKSIQFMSGFRYVLLKTEDDEPFLSIQNMEHAFNIDDDVDVILTKDIYPIMTR
tara:strand:- start:20598 stop:21659 length:1062 start_codon:yes stop_codon:yes gene_type:complete